MAFVADDLGAWLIGLLADKVRKNLTTLILGTEQERALRSAATAAVKQVAIELHPADDEQAEYLALVISQVFSEPVPDVWLAQHKTLLETLHVSIAGQLAVLDDVSLSGQHQSSADVLGVPGEVLAEKLTSYLLQEIVARGSRGGHLFPLASQLNHDMTHLQGEHLKNMVGRLRDEVRVAIAQLDPGELALGKSGQVVVGEIPREPPGFVVRNALADLTEVMMRKRVAVVCAVTGLRGVGKTQIAATYARTQIQQGCSLVAWVDAETHDGLLAGLARVAARLEIADPEGDSLESARRLREHLDLRTSGLLVFDNATDPNALRPFLPATGGTQVIITTIDRAFTELGQAVDLTSYSREESLEYLRERTGLDDEVGADAVASQLGDLPAALSQAAAAIRSRHLNHSQYVEQLRWVPANEMLARVPGGDYPQSAAAALLLSIQAIVDSDSSGLIDKLLRMVAALSPSGVPHYMLSGLAPIRNRGAFDSAVERCVTGSLLTWSVLGDAVIMHSLLGRVVRERDKAAGRWTSTVELVLGTFEPLLFDEAEAWARREEVSQLSVQIEALWVASVADGLSQQLAVRLLHARSWAVCRLRAAANFSRAIDLAKRVLTDHERMLGNDHPDTLRSRGNLADVYKSAGMMSEAVPLYEQTLASQERLLGAGHSDAMITRDKLAQAYLSTHASAPIPLFQQVLADRERVLGSNHPDTLTSRNNLANAYLHSVQLAKAISLFEQTVTDRQRILGPDHPDTMTSMSDLADAYRFAEEHGFNVNGFMLGDARELHELTLTRRELILGPNHPDTIASRIKVALCYVPLQMFDKVIPLMERTLADAERVLDPENPLIIFAQSNLGEAYSSVGRYSEAVPLFERSLLHAERIWGPDHEHTVFIRQGLTNAWQRATSVWFDAPESDLGQAVYRQTGFLQ
jgi:tetratricopeptide (TPR) repeat protein